MRIIFNRLFFIFKTEGLKGLIERIANKILYEFGLQRSETLFFSINVSENFKKSHPTKHQSLNGMAFKAIYDLKTLYGVKKLPGKMDYVPKEKWFDRGSKCLALILNDRIIAYTWVHRKFYDNLGAAGVLELSEHEVFIGPFYTDPEFRKKGLYHFLMYHSLSWIKNNNTNWVYGTSNISNIPTIKVFIKNNFSLLGIVNATKNKFEILEFDLSISLNQKIKKKP